MANIFAKVGIAGLYFRAHSFFSGSCHGFGPLFPPGAAKLIEKAEEAGISRMYGGIHCHFDNTEGRKNGIGVGNVAISWALQDGALYP